MGMEQFRLGVVEVAASGTDPDADRIVAARVAVLDEAGDVVARWDWGSDRAESLAGEVAQTLRTLLAVGVPLATYDAAAGLTILDRECRRRYIPALEDPFPVLDALLLDHLIAPDLRDSRSLNAMAERYGVPPGSLAAGRIVAAMLRDRLDGTPEELHRRQAELLDFWPIVPLNDIRLIEDTQPLPAPPPRASETVPMFEFTETGLVETVQEPVAEAEPELPLETPGPEFAPVLAEVPLPEPMAPATFVEPEVSGDDDSGPVLVLPDLPGAASRRIHVAAAIVTDTAGRAIVVRKRGTTGYMQPGGKIERGESALAALIRELDEELHLQVDVDATEFLGSYEAPALNEPGRTVRAEVFALQTDAELTPSAEIDAVYWLESPDDTDSVPLAPLTLDVLLPLWRSRRPALF